MTKHKHLRKNDQWRKLVESVGGCTAETVPSILKAAQVIGEEAVVVAAAAALGNSMSGAPTDREAVAACINSLAACRHKSAAALLMHLAENAAIGRVKLEAVRRLGGLALGTEARDLLRQLAKEGFEAKQHFSNDRVSSDEFRVAAMESLGRVSKPASEDVQAILDVVGEQVQSGGRSPVFDAAVEALYCLAAPAALGPLLDIAEKCEDRAKCLAILCVLSSLGSGALRAQKKRLARQIPRAMTEWADKPPIPERLTALVKKVVCAELIQELSRSFRKDHFGHGRGAICRSALETYRATDDALAAAYLEFAQAPVNTDPKGPCVMGLAKCARAGRSKTIMSRMIQQTQAGYDRLVQCGLLAEIFGGVQETVDLICETLDEDQKALARPEIAEKCGTSILAMSLVGAADAELAGQVRGSPAWRASRSRDREGKMVASLRACNLNQNGIRRLGERITSHQEEHSAVAILASLLQQQGPLAEYLVEVVIMSTANVELAPREGLPSESSLARLEPLLFPAYKQALGSVLPRLVFADGKLNRFALDLMRRHSIGFYESARSVLKRAPAAEDALFIVELLTVPSGSDSIQALGEAIEFNSKDARASEKVRARAIDSTCEFFEKPDRSVDTKPPEGIFRRVHDRFGDSLAVRLAAYRACGRLADARSIRPLRDRLQTESNDDCKKAIRSALEAIARLLGTERPPHSDTEATVAWLGQVAALGDASFLGQVTEYLLPPHSNEKVRIAALQCFEGLGHDRAVDIIDRFMSETSPFGVVLAAARHAKLTLQGRCDLGLVEVFGKFFEPNSEVFAPSHDYEVLLGPTRLRKVTKGLEDASRQREDGHWDDFVTALNGVCEGLNRHLYESHWQQMGLDEQSARKMARQGYRNRLDMSEFKTAFSSLRPLMDSIYQLRHEARTAHQEDTDGTEKPGLDEPDAKFALEQFRRLFINYIEVLQDTVRGEAGGSTNS